MISAAEIILILLTSLISVTLMILMAKLIIKDKGNFLVVSILIFSILPSLIFMISNEDMFTVNGWTAVGDFDFTLASYLMTVLWYSVPITSIILSYWLISKIFSVGRLSSYSHFEAGRAGVQIEERKSLSILLIVFLILMALPFLMLKWNIGVPGIAPESLPFKITGGIYYFARLVLPAMLLFIFYKYRITAANHFILIIPIIIICLIAMSKYQAVVLFSPIIIVALIKRRYALGLVFSVIAVITIDVSNYIRYDFIDSTKGYLLMMDRDIEAIINRSVEIAGYDRLFHITLVLFGRLASIQNTILAVQINDLMGNSPFGYFPIIGPYFDFFSTVNAAPGSLLTHGFVPAVGAATGLDLVAHQVILFKHAPFVYVAGCFFLSSMMILNHILVAVIKSIPIDLKWVCVFMLTSMMLFLPFFWWLLLIVFLVAVFVFQQVFSLFRMKN